MLRDQLRVSLKKLERPAIYSFYDPSAWYRGARHYDLCFVYEVPGSPPRDLPAWWQRLELVRPSFLRNQDLGSAMSDLVRVLKFSRGR